MTKNKILLTICRTASKVSNQPSFIPQSTAPYPALVSAPLHPTPSPDYCTLRRTVILSSSLHPLGQSIAVQFCEPPADADFINLTALREQLLHHVNDPNSQQPQSLGPQVQSTPGLTNHAHNIDPAIAGPGMMSHSPGESGGDDPATPESKRGTSKRELSTSKRAAQNRQAQVSLFVHSQKRPRRVVAPSFLRLTSSLPIPAIKSRFN